MSEKELRKYIEQEIDTLSIIKERNENLSFQDGGIDPDSLMIKTYYDRMSVILSAVDNNYVYEKE